MALVAAVDGLFDVLDAGEIPAHTVGWSNGLIAVKSAGARIATGERRLRPRPGAHQHRGAAHPTGPVRGAGGSPRGHHARPHRPPALAVPGTR